MQVILLERVPKLGMMGEVVTVRSGYARNFLIPQGKALRATEAARRDFERRRGQLEARNLERKQDAQKAAREIDGRSVTILRQASESSQLYGSVSTRDIAAAFTEAGVALDRQQLLLEQPLKTLGIHEVVVALHPEVEVTVRVNVARSPEEADIQAGKLPPPEEPTADELEVDTGDDPGLLGLEAALAQT
ncbi:MAG TPA: 50S ribosomal protein L9 [Geminicoccaceae bacterium]|nr:50S ribosomal protein L9 [Geminicoccaceae bacterium]